MAKIEVSQYGEREIPLGRDYLAITSIPGNLEIWRRGVLVAEIKRSHIPDLLELLQQAGYKQREGATDACK